MGTSVEGVERMCPRCGARFSYLERRRVKDQVYVYAVHESKAGGKRIRRRCYLGPEGAYLHVNLTHAGMLMLTGLPSRDPVLYLESLLAYFALHPTVREEDARRALEACRRWLPRIAERVTGEA